MVPCCIDVRRVRRLEGCVICDGGSRGASICRLEPTVVDCVEARETRCCQERVLWAFGA